MNFEEMKILKEKLKNYGFKFDDDILENIVKCYDPKSVFKIYQNIIENKERLNGLNIIAELKEQLKSAQWTEHAQISHYRKDCEICGNSGRIYKHDADDDLWYTECCDCEHGHHLKKILKLV